MAYIMSSGLRIGGEEEENGGERGGGKGSSDIVTFVFIVFYLF
jgi:hypothetical protein